MSDPLHEMRRARRAGKRRGAYRGDPHESEQAPPHIPIVSQGPRGRAPSAPEPTADDWLRSMARDYPPGGHLRHWPTP
jgi:hypothetical protein